MAITRSIRKQLHALFDDYVSHLFEWIALFMQ
jgi:hypothetical protein